MRAQARKGIEEEEDESAFISMTDMTVGFLFIVLILLAFFASQFQQANRDTVPKIKWEIERDARMKAETEVARLEKENEELRKKLRDPLELYLTRVAATRRKILEQLRDALKEDFPDLQVVLSSQGDALRFQGDGLFESGSAELREDKLPVIERIAERLNQILPCYTFRQQQSHPDGCNEHDAVIEAVQVEGHTDAQGTYVYNINLSAARATRTFELMIGEIPGLREYKNTRDQSVMSFAGYGPDRPITSNNNAEGRATNRRIDLRFIMLTPASLAEVENIRDRFANMIKEER